MNIRLFLSLVFIAFLILYAHAQPQRKLVKVIVSPDQTDWTYDIGQRPEFTISVLRNNSSMEGIEIRYTLQPDPGYRTIAIWDEGTVSLKNGTARVKGKKMDQPGFLRFTATVTVGGEEYSSYTTVGFAPENIRPTTTLPADFHEFWNQGKEELSAIPINPILTLLPERCTDKVDVYHVALDNVKGKIYGILCRPKKEGSYPAILRVPGAGIRPYYGNIQDAEAGFLSFTIGIHGIPVNLEKQVYDHLMQGALNNYWTTNLDDKENAYYRRVYLGCVRAVDFLETLDDFNGEDIGVTGGSQGGALSIVTAGLDDRIDYLAAFYPALSDLTGFLHGRAGGWPQIFVDEYTNKPEKIATSKYFDVVNFARFVKAPGWYSWGYNDHVCPPVSMFAAYNVINAPKELHVFQETQHWTFPEQREQRNAWLYQKLGE